MKPLHPLERTVEEPAMARHSEDFVELLECPCRGLDGDHMLARRQCRLRDAGCLVGGSADGDECHVTMFQQVLIV
jgi:hypothetical protein